MLTHTLLHTHKKVLMSKVPQLQRKNDIIIKGHLKAITSLLLELLQIKLLIFSKKESVN